jgi:hypothetical protein
MARPAHGQKLPALPGSRITDSGVVRAGAAIDSVFVLRTRSADTVDIGDFAAQLIARIGAPPFGDSLAFRVTSDTALIRVAGRLTDFPPDVRADLRPLFAFIDSNSVFVADISMPQHSGGVMRFHLDRVTVRGLTIPDLLLIPALQQYTLLYPTLLASGGREFLVAMPTDGSARLVRNGIELTLPRQP